MTSSGTKGNTGNCRNANKNKGDCAEKLLQEFYTQQGYKPLSSRKNKNNKKKSLTKSLTNKQGNGIDHAFTNKKGELVFIETKGTSNPLSTRIPLSKLQKKGGKKYIDGRIQAMLDGYHKGEGPWAKYKNDKNFQKKIKKLKKFKKKAKKITYKKCRVWVKHDKSGCYAKSSPSGKKPHTGTCESHSQKNKPDCQPW